MDKESQTRKLRYNKCLLERFNYDEICQDLNDISEQCSEIRWMAEYEDVLISALGDNEEEAYEFKMAFSELDSKCEQLLEQIYNQREEEYVQDYFDEFFAGVASGTGMKYYAYDAADEDYYQVTSFEGNICAQEAQKKLQRMTKTDLISCANRCFRIMTAYLDLKYRYDYLSATMDILNDEQKGVLDMVKEIDRLYSEAEKEKFDCFENVTKEYEHILKSVPDRMWIE